MFYRGGKLSLEKVCQIENSKQANFSDFQQLANYFLHTLKAISTLKMGVFWGANQTERSLREGMTHVYFACLQDTCGVNMLNFFFGLKKNFQEKKCHHFLRLP